MRRWLVLLMLLALLIPAASVAAAETVYVDDDGLCGGNTPCYPHPQDAVNAVSPGSTIIIYPGTYGARSGECPWGAACSCSDNFAPTLIIYKNNLTLTSQTGNPASVVIEATHGCWSNPEAVFNSTDGGVTPMFGSAPNAVDIIADGVVLDRVTIRRPYDAGAGGQDTVLIGGMYVGWGQHGEPLGFDGNVVRNSVMGGGAAQNRNGVTIYHSKNNILQSNTVLDPQSSAFNLFDGADATQVTLPNQSTGNRVLNNTVVDNPATPSLGQCVFVGAWYGPNAPTAPRTNNTGTLVQGNNCGGEGLFTAYSTGAKVFRNNTNVGWTSVVFASDYLFINSGPAPTTNVAPQGMDQLQFGRPAGR